MLRYRGGRSLLRRLPAASLPAWRRFAAGSAPQQCAAAHAAEVGRLFRQELDDAPPPLLQAFLQVQQLHGHELLAPDDASVITAGLHPLLVPLTHCRESAAVQGLLRMPPSVALGGDFRWALVEAPLAGGGDATVHHYRLLAQDVAMHVNRIAAQTDAAAQPTADAAAVSAAMEEARERGEDGYIYTAGEAPAGGGEEGVNKQLRAFLLTKVGMFPVRSHACPCPHTPTPIQRARLTEVGLCWGVKDLLQQLSAEHLERGDLTAASVASARAADSHFGWGSGYWHQAKLMAHTSQPARPSHRRHLLRGLVTSG